MKRKIWGGIVTSVGFLLSPLSWWNDIVINIPLAYGFAILMSLILPQYFSLFMIIGYWFTNVLGLMLMHKGGTLVIGDVSESYGVHGLLQDLKMSVVYSLVIALLVITHVLRLPASLFPH